MKGGVIVEGRQRDLDGKKYEWELELVRKDLQRDENAARERESSAREELAGEGTKEGRRKLPLRVCIHGKSEVI